MTAPLSLDVFEELQRANLDLGRRCDELQAEMVRLRAEGAGMRELLRELDCGDCPECGGVTAPVAKPGARS